MWRPKNLRSKIMARAFFRCSHSHSCSKQARTTSMAVLRLSEQRLSGNKPDSGDIYAVTQGPMPCWAWVGPHCYIHIHNLGQTGISGLMSSLLQMCRLSAVLPDDRWTECTPCCAKFGADPSAPGVCARIVKRKYSILCHARAQHVNFLQCKWPP